MADKKYSDDSVIEDLGNHLAQKHGYSVTGHDAIVLYLVNKHHWKLHFVENVLKYDDCIFILDQELTEYKKEIDALR